MTTRHLEVTDTAGDQALAHLLRSAHEIWIRETTLFLSPITKPGAGFWERWTAVRYLADQFQGPFYRERWLVDEMRPLLPAETADRLALEREHLTQLERALDEFGRRRGTARTVAVVSRGFLDLLRQWCSDIELAAEHISRDVIPPKAAPLIAEFEAYVRTQSLEMTA